MPETPWTPEREAAAEARCGAATEGPWFTWTSATGWHYLDSRAERDCSCCGRPEPIGAISEGFENASDGAFCAHARTDLPDPIREIQRLREVNARLEGKIDDMSENIFQRMRTR